MGYNSRLHRSECIFRFIRPAFQVSKKRKMIEQKCAAMLRSQDGYWFPVQQWRSMKKPIHSRLDSQLPRLMYCRLRLRESPQVVHFQFVHPVRWVLQLHSQLPAGSPTLVFLVHFFGDSGSCKTEEIE